MSTCLRGSPARAHGEQVRGLLGLRASATLLGPAGLEVGAQPRGGAFTGLLDLHGHGIRRVVSSVQPPPLFLTGLRLEAPERVVFSGTLATGDEDGRGEVSVGQGGGRHTFSGAPFVSDVHHGSVLPVSPK